MWRDSITPLAVLVPPLSLPSCARVRASRNRHQLVLDFRKVVVLLWTHVYLVLGLLHQSPLVHHQPHAPSVHLNLCVSERQRLSLRDLVHCVERNDFERMSVETVPRCDAQSLSLSLIFAPCSFFAVNTTTPVSSPTRHSFTRIFVPSPFDRLTTTLELTTCERWVGRHEKDENKPAGQHSVPSDSDQLDKDSVPHPRGSAHTP